MKAIARLSKPLLQLRVLLSIATTIPTTPISTDDILSSSFVTGDLEMWDRIFASRSLQVVLDGPSNNLMWTEGPIIVGNDLVFSDTIRAKIYSLDLQSMSEKENLDDSSKEDGSTKYLRIIKARSGDCPPGDDEWRAEPGSNGLALVPNESIDVDESSTTVLMCQHGARRLATMDMSTGNILALATEYGGKRLNGPNDVVVRTEEEENVEGEENRVTRTYAYFTDPVYAWLEKDRFEDLPYLDDMVKKEGPGYCGVYRIEIDITSGNAITKGNVELISSDISRPNGIGFDEGDLIVSDCCQGSHLNGCTSGISRWNIFRKQVGNSADAGSSWIHSAAIEDVVPAEKAIGGCADGFAIFSFDDERSTYGRRKRRNKHVLLASCYGGLCIVDLEIGEVIARVWTATKKHDGCKISNVAIGISRVYLTGSCGILMIPLKEKKQANGRDPYDHNHETVHGEL